MNNLNRLFFITLKGSLVSGRMISGIVFCASLMVIATTQTGYSAVLAEVNGKKITDQDIKNSINQLNPSMQREILKDRFARAKIVQNLIDQELLLNEAKKNRISKRREYQKAIEEFKKQAQIDLLIRTKIDRQVTEKAALAYYQKNKNEFRTDQVKAKHILIKDLEKADQVAKLAKKKGANFDALIKKYSEDTNLKNNQGDLGYFPRDRFEPSFTRPVFKAVKGDIVGPIRTRFGFHIVKVLDREPGTQLTFEQSEIQARAAVRQEYLKKYMQQLKKQYSVKLFEKNL